MKYWKLDGDVLKLSVQGELFNASTEYIYTTFIEQPSNSKFQDSPELGDAEKLSFSKKTLRVLAIPEISSDKESFEAKFIACSQTGGQFNISYSALKNGHVVNKNTWFPLEPSETADTLELLRKSDFDFETGEIKTLLGVLNLKKAGLNSGQITDKISDETLKKIIIEKTKIYVPVGINASLYPYQSAGWRWLNFIIQEQLGGILGDEMGLGKTLQIICALKNTLDADNSNVLVIVPSSLLENWVREIAKFCPDVQVLKHHGPIRTGSPNELRKYELVITSYETVIRDISLYEMIKWRVVVLDEAQNIRNPNSLRTKTVKKIPRSVGLAVTGTPIENRILDLWSIIDFVVPNYLGDLKKFTSEYIDEITDLSELEQLVKPLILRRKVSEVATDLPDRIDITEFLELNESESLKYEETRLKIKAECGMSQTLVTLVKLRQFCAHPDLIKRDFAEKWVNFSKFNRLLELLEEIFGLNEKVIVFTSYRIMADKIIDITRIQFGIEAKVIDGRLNIDERQPLIDKFESDKKSALLVLNPRAGGTGLNITAANHVIHYNPEWNPALVDQASARVYRRGQTRPVTIRQLIYLGTVEEVINERLERKRLVANAVIQGVRGNENDYTDIVAALEKSPITI